MQHQHSSPMTERGQQPRGRDGGESVPTGSWANKYLKPYRGLFIAIGVIALAFIAVWLWFALS